jgi:hypothetical protein
MKKSVGVYLRVSADGQTTENQSWFRVFLGLGRCASATV